MSARYRLPAELGGQEFEGYPSGKKIMLDIPGLGLRGFDAEDVTLILPAEAFDETWVVVRKPDSWESDVFSRHDDAAEAAGKGDYHWWWHDAKIWVTWAEVAAKGDVRILAAGYSKGNKGICPVCKTERSLRQDGRIMSHGRHRGCAGGGELPAKDVTL